MKPTITHDYTTPSCYVDGVTTIGVDMLVNAMQDAGASTTIADHSIAVHPHVLSRLRRNSVLDPIGGRETFLGRSVEVRTNDTMDVARPGVFITIVEGPTNRVHLITREY